MTLSCFKPNIIIIIIINTILNGLLNINSFTLWVGFQSQPQFRRLSYVSARVQFLSRQGSTMTVIPHLEIRACDWSKSRHVAVNISRDCLSRDTFALINYAC